MVKKRKHSSKLEHTKTVEDIISEPEDLNLTEFKDKEQELSTNIRKISKKSKANNKKRIIIYNRKRKMKIPKIQRTNFDEFISLLNHKNDSINENQKLKDCLAHMYTQVKPHWTSPSHIMKAMQHCLLTRNWNTLTHLLLVMIEHRCEKYKPIIRHMCQIISELHPVVVDEDLQKQFKIMHDVAAKKASARR